MNRSRLVVSVLLALIPVAGPGAVRAASMDECRTISDRLARYACYDGLDTGATGRSAPSTPRTTTAPATSTTATTNASTTDASTFGRPVARQPEPAAEEDNDEGLLGGLPVIGRFFGGDDEGDSDEDAAAAENEDQTAPEPTTTTVASSSVENFGRREDNSRIIEGSGGRTELRADITGLEQIGPSLWLVTLENGQKWRQMETKAYRLREGDAVRIYPTRWGGAFRLSVERLGGYIQVQRVD